MLNSFTFVLPHTVIDFLLNNQPDALIIQIYSMFHPDSAWMRSSETCMKLTGAEFTLENP